MSEVVSEVIKREKKQKQKQRKQYPMTLYRRSYEVCVPQVLAIDQSKFQSNEFKTRSNCAYALVISGIFETSNIRIRLWL